MANITKDVSTFFFFLKHIYVCIWTKCASDHSARKDFTGKQGSVTFLTHFSLRFLLGWVITPGLMKLWAPSDGANF